MTKDWPHQSLEYKIGREKRSRALIWPMRSGKTKTCIDKGCYQCNRGKIEGVIIIAPNGVHLNWLNEIKKWAWDEMIHTSFAWETAKRGFPEQEQKFEHMLRHGELKWFAINMEALKHEDNRRAIKRFLKACHGKFMLIVSEAHHFGHAGSKRTYFARSLAYHAAYVQTETGTPILTGPLRAFSQFELLAPGALGFANYKDFEEHHVEFEPARAGDRRGYRKVKAYLNLDELTRHIAKWSSVVLREDLHDMPPIVATERPVIMSEVQRRAYQQMVEHHLAEIGNEHITVKDAGPRMMKLQQALHGYMIDDIGRPLTIDADAPIYDACIDEIKGTLPGKALVWCRYKEDIRRLAAKLGKAKLAHLEYHGDITDPVEREKNRKTFLTDDRFGVMLGTPDAGGEGLDFSAASAVIFFSAAPNARLIAQAQERATVKGGKSIAVVRMRHYGTVDDRIWSIIDGNISLADTVTGHGLRDLLLATDI